MAKVAVRPAARADLEAIVDRIARNNPQAAVALVDRIEQKFTVLSDYPYTNGP